MISAFGAHTLLQNGRDEGISDLQSWKATVNTIWRRTQDLEIELDEAAMYINTNANADTYVRSCVLLWTVSWPPAMCAVHEDMDR